VLYVHLHASIFAVVAMDYRHCYLLYKTKVPFLFNKKIYGSELAVVDCTPFVLFYLSRFSSKNKLAGDKYSKTEVVSYYQSN
jgi:uncharacterized Fe-S radical SAM superfamily protein PflX